MGDWKERERERFASGEYKPLPWAHEGWWIALTSPGQPLAEHFAHVSGEDPAQIAFTETPQKGERDIQTRVRPGRYLRRFVKGLEDWQIQGWAGRYAAENEELILKIARDAKTIERVYVDGPNSCMGYPAGNFAGQVHPSHAYASPDLGVGYLEREGSISARCVVWPEKKIHSRIYGDLDRMRRALSDAGYEEGELHGARLARIEWGRGEGFVGPYVDNCEAATDDGDYLTLNDAGDYSVQRTDGLIMCWGERCYYCENRFDSDSMVHYEFLDGPTCERCADERVRLCDECYEASDPDGMVHVESRGSLLCEPCADRMTVGCAECGDTVMTSDTVSDRAGDDYCRDCAEDCLQMCEECSEVTHSDSMGEAEECKACESADSDSVQGAEVSNV